jgi:hypothetical protein
MSAAALALAVALFILPGPIHGDAAPTTQCPDGSAGAPTAAALRPAGVLLALSFPRAGESVSRAQPSDSITLGVDYWGPKLVASTGPRPIDANYHLVFLLDDDASSYFDTLSPIPRCDAHIVHTEETHVTFDHVLHGEHYLWVVLVGSNDVSVNPPVATCVTFVVQ